MKKQILTLTAIVPIMLLSCLNKDNRKEIEAPGIFAEQETLVANPDRSISSNHSHSRSMSPDNSWQTYLSPD